ncbi:MAG: GbsR/MarR family transcriptional regulator [Candidatus Nanohalobium sp.]
MTELGPEERVIQAMEETADLYNFNRSYVRMYGRLFFSGEMTLDEISEETGLSKSTVSRGMNKLESMYMVKSRKKEGYGKTKFYTAEEDIEKAMMKLMENEATREIEIMTAALDKAEEQFRERGDDEGLEKVRGLQRCYGRAEKFIGLMTKLPSGEAFDRMQSALSRVVPRND